MMSRIRYSQSCARVNEVARIWHRDTIDTIRMDILLFISAMVAPFGAHACPTKHGRKNGMKRTHKKNSVFCFVPIGESEQFLVMFWRTKQDAFRKSLSQHNTQRKKKTNKTERQSQTGLRMLRVMLLLCVRVCVPNGSAVHFCPFAFIVFLCRAKITRQTDVSKILLLCSHCSGAMFS